MELKAPEDQPEEITPAEPQQVAPQLFQTIIDQKQEEPEEVFEQEKEEQEPARPIELSPREIARQRLNLGNKLIQCLLGIRKIIRIPIHVGEAEIVGAVTQTLGDGQNLL